MELRRIWSYSQSPTTEDTSTCIKKALLAACGSWPVCACLHTSEHLFAQISTTFGDDISVWRTSASIEPVAQMRSLVHGLRWRRSFPSSACSNTHQIELHLSMYKISHKPSNCIRLDSSSPRCTSRRERRGAYRRRYQPRDCPKTDLSEDCQPPSQFPLLTLCVSSLDLQTYR